MGIEAKRVPVLGLVITAATVGATPGTTPFNPTVPIPGAGWAARVAEVTPIKATKANIRAKNKPL